MKPIMNGEVVEKRAIRKTARTAQRDETDFPCRAYRKADVKLGDSSKAMARCKAPKVIDSLSAVHVMARRADLRTNSEKAIVVVTKKIWADWKRDECLLTYFEMFSFGLHRPSLEFVLRADEMSGGIGGQPARLRDEVIAKQVSTATEKTRVHSSRSSTKRMSRGDGIDAGYYSDSPLICPAPELSG